MILIGTFGFRMIVPYALIHGRYPECTFLIRRKMGNGGMDIHGKTLEDLTVVIDEEHSLSSTYIQSVVARQQGRDILVDAQFWNAQR